MFNLSSLSTRRRSNTRNRANMRAPIMEQMALRGSLLTRRSLVDHDTNTMPPMLPVPHNQKQSATQRLLNNICSNGKNIYVQLKMYGGKYYIYNVSVTHQTKWYWHVIRLLKKKWPTDKQFVILQHYHANMQQQKLNASTELNKL